MRKANTKRINTAGKRGEMRYSGATFILNFVKRAVPDTQVNSATVNAVCSYLDAQVRLPNPTRKQRKEMLDKLIKESLENQG